MSTLFYGDNLDVLRKKIKDETIDLCYIDPPFNSKRNYNQIYNNMGSEDRAQARAFVDTWTWNTQAMEGFAEIIANDAGRFNQKTVDLIKGLRPVLKEGGLLAYLVSMTLRVVEIRRVLKETGSLYLHCDPTASHYLKIVLDAVFCTERGEFVNEIVWSYRSGGGSKRHFGWKHDVLLWFAKTDKYTFNADEVRVPYDAAIAKSREHLFNKEGKVAGDVWDISRPPNHSKEWLGYPTQKPEAVLERVLKASSNAGDVILDAYCGCGTTVAVSERLGRKWIGIDITYQSISLVLRRLEGQLGSVKWAELTKSLVVDGIPRDVASAVALANRRDDRLRKEFEKWAVLTYTNNRGRIHEAKGADGGVDGVVYFLTNPTDSATMVIQVKSGGVGRGDVARLRGDMSREGAVMATLITLEKPTAPMVAEAKSAGQYKHELMGRNYDVIQIVTVHEIVEANKRLELPMSLEVLKKARPRADAEQLGLLSHDDEEDR